MPSKKKQHYVPQFLLRNFAEESKKRINVLLRSNGKIIPKASLKAQCYRNNFYGSEHIENELCKLERVHSALFHELISINAQHEYNQLAEIKHVKILEALLLQRGRTQLELQKSEGSLTEIATSWFQEYVNNKDDIDPFIKENLQHITMVPTDAYAIVNKLTVALDAAPLASDLKVYLLKNKTDIEFVLSDSPVVFYNRYYRGVKRRGVLGLQCPGLMIFFPISPCTSIMLIDELKYEIESEENNIINLIHEFDVVYLNKLQLHHSQNAIYFSSGMNERLLKKMWKRERKNLSILKNSLTKSSKFLIDDDKTKELMHSFEKQIPYNLDLSFIKSDILGDSQYRFSYRLGKEVVREFMGEDI